MTKEKAKEYYEDGLFCQVEFNLIMGTTGPTCADLKCNTGCLKQR